MNDNIIYVYSNTDSKQSKGIPMEEAVPSLIPREDAIEFTAVPI